MWRDICLFFFGGGGVFLLFKKQTSSFFLFFVFFFFVDVVGFFFPQNSFPFSPLFLKMVVSFKLQNNPNLQIA